MGFRPSHGAVSHSGVLPVSTSLDTVGMYKFLYTSLENMIMCNYMYMQEKSNNTCNVAFFDSIVIKEIKFARIVNLWILFPYLCII